MSNIRSLLYTDAATVVVPLLQEFLVGNLNYGSGNGGCCCLWTVPEDVTYIKFQVWGGGGGGGGSCCCMQGRPGGSGSFTMKTVTGQLGGCQYTICAGGTSLHSNTNAGCPGCTSYVTGQGLSGFCARGGCGGCSRCQYFRNCYTCQHMCTRECCATGGDLNIHSTSGGVIASQYCLYNGQQYVPVAPGTVSGPLFGPPGCTCTWCTDGNSPHPVFPGGAGFTAQTYAGGCRCGWPGEAGAVSVTFG